MTLRPLLEAKGSFFFGFLMEQIKRLNGGILRLDIDLSRIRPLFVPFAQNKLAVPFGIAFVPQDC
jgi:hypothetical protein